MMEKKMKKNEYEKYYIDVMMIIFGRKSVSYKGIGSPVGEG